MANSEYNKARYEWYKAHKICTKCGVNEACKGRTLCLECRFIAIERTQKCQKKSGEAYKEYQRQYQRELRQYRKENGLCQQCGRPTQNGMVLCIEHNAKMRVKAENKRREQGIMPRWLMGKGEFCYFCGDKVENKGDKTCKACYERECKWAADMRQRIDYENHYWKGLNNVTFRKIRYKEANCG